MANPTIMEIVREYLSTHGYDGLYNTGSDRCACKLGDLAPCGEISEYCTAGYMQPCDCGDHDYHIGTVKCEDNHD